MATASGTTSPTLPGTLLVTVWLAAFLVSFDYSALNVALPSLAGQMNVGSSEVSWAALSYMLALIALIPLAGHALNRLGYRRALCGALVLFAAASLACAAATDLWFLVAMRALQGGAAAILFVIGPALIKTAVPEAHQTRAFALFATGPVAGFCAGPGVGGMLTGAFGWQAVFYANLPVVLIALILAQVIAPTLRAAAAHHTDKPAPLPGAHLLATAMGGLLALLVALNQGQEWGWTSPAILGLFAGAVVLLAAFVALERRAEVPLFDPALFGAPDFRRVALAFLLALCAFGGSLFLLPFYLEWVHKMPTGAVGRLLMVQPLATIAASSAAGFLVGHIAARTSCLIGIAVFAASLALLAALGPDAGTPALVVVLVLLGGGIGMFYAVLMQAGMAGLPHHLAAAASSTQALVRMLAQLLGVALLETMLSGLDTVTLDARKAAAVTGSNLDLLETAFTVTLAGAALLAALALLPAWRLGRSHSTEAEAP